MPDGLTIEQKIVFAVSMKGQGDDVPVVLLGIPKGAWEYMMDGKTHTFDLTKAGIPVKLMLYGAANAAGSHHHCLKSMDLANEVNGTRAPTTGDICICLYCGNINILDANGLLRPWSEQKDEPLSEDLKQHIKQTLVMVELINLLRKRD